MEIHIIIALSLTVLILLFLLTRQRDEVGRLRDEVETLKRLEPEVVRLQRRVSEDVHKASNLEEEVTRLQTALSKEKQHNESLREAINPQNKTPSANFKTTPPALSHDDDYWWSLSTWYRQEQDWICERCGIDLSKRTYFLHTHHIHGRSWNDPEHLEALCIKCHAEKPDHHFMKEKRDYKRFLKTPEYRNHRTNKKYRSLS